MSLPHIGHVLVDILALILETLVDSQFDQLAELSDAPNFELERCIPGVQAHLADIKFQPLRLHISILLVLDRVVDLSE